MTESKIEALAALLGVLMNTPFYINFPDNRDIHGNGNRFRWMFTNTGLVRIFVDGDIDYGCCNETLRKLIIGEASVELIPWVPKVGDKYWKYGCNLDATEANWDGDHYDMCQWRDGNVYPTYAAARAAIEHHKERDRQTLAEIEKLRK